MKRMIAASTIVVVVAIATAFSPGSGVASPGVPAGLVNALHARFGAGSVTPSSAQAIRPPATLFGYQVSLSADGTTALVAAPGVGADTGAVYIFHVSSAGSWTSSATPNATLTNGKGAYFDIFGLQVALSADGTTAFVAAPFSRFPDGGIYVFHVSSEDAWASTATPTATLTVNNDIFLGEGSIAPSADGTTLLVGTPFHDGLAGGAYVFHVASEGAWVSSSTPTAVLSNAAEPQNDLAVGVAVAISGDGTTALLSDSVAGNGRGGAYVFHVASEAAWASSTSPTAILSKANAGAGDGMGSTLALSNDGTTAFLGAPGVHGNAGAVDVFHASTEISWASSSTPTATLTNAAGSGDDFLGSAVAVSATGTTAVATATGVGDEAGAAYVFHVASEAGWSSSSVPTAALTDSAGVALDGLGVGLALSTDGATALVGVPGFTTDVGAAEVFHASDESSWATSSTPTAQLTDSVLLHPKCVVPHVKGLFLSTARFVLRGFGCRVGQVTNAYSPVRPGRVIAQYPKAGNVLRLGTKVNLRLSLGKWHR